MRKRRPTQNQSLLLFTLLNRSLLLVMLFCSLAAPLQAQRYLLKQANDHFRRGAIRASIPIYRQVLEQRDVPLAKRRLAEAYRRIGDYHTAAHWYSIVVNMEEHRAEDRLQYGFCLLRIGNCRGAKDWFKAYLELRPYDHRKPELLKACEHQAALQQRNRNLVSVKPLSINSSGNELAPAFYQDGLVLTKGKEGEATAALFFARRLSQNPARFGRLAPFSTSLDQEFHESAAAFNQAQDQIFFTRTRTTHRRGELQRLEISSARALPQGGWSSLKALPFGSDDYSVAHPSVSADGRYLFFSSDRPGGVGGKDLYLSIWRDGWSEPVNLGETINTAGDEVFPHLTEDGVLYFASDGHFGLGGQDLFKTRENEEGFWQRPQNLGAPFNTSADDFAIAIDSSGREGFFTSNRQGGQGGDDLYYFRFTGRVVQVDFLELNTSRPLPYAQLSLEGKRDTLEADSSGRLWLRRSECVQLTGFKAGFHSKQVEVCPQEVGAGRDTLFVAIALKPKAQYKMKGVVFDRATGRPVKGAALQLQSDSCAAPAIAYSDELGQFSFPLNKDCCYRLSVRQEAYLTHYSKEEVCASEGEPEQYVNVFLQPTGSGQLNGGGAPAAGHSVPPGQGASPEGLEGFERIPGHQNDGTGAVYRINVYYDVGRSSVQPSSVPELFRLRDLLLNNPELKVEIRSHTDSEGGAAFNRRLSQRRADKIVQYLVSKGIKRHRLRARGYGESRLLNGCSDGVPCDSWQHQENRRTEFRILN